MSKFFLYSGISALIISIIVGFIAVSNNASEIKIRRDLKKEIKNQKTAKVEFEKEMLDLNLKTDSISTYLTKTCECDIDSVTIVKISNDSKVTLKEKDFNKAKRSLRKYRKIESDLYSKWEDHISMVKAIEGWTGENREILNLGGLIIYGKGN